MVVKSLEEYTQDGAADREDELILIKVCLVRAACGRSSSITQWE